MRMALDFVSYFIDQLTSYAFCFASCTRLVVVFITSFENFAGWSNKILSYRVINFHFVSHIT